MTMGLGLGFEFTESMSGTWYRFDDALHDRPMRATFRHGVGGMRRFLRERRVDVRGTLDAEGLAEGGAALEGTLVWRLWDEQRVPYDLAFRGDDGRMYALRGQRDFFVHDAVESLTILTASIYDDRDEEIGRATLRFDVRSQLAPTLRSFRPRVLGLFSKGSLRKEK